MENVKKSYSTIVDVPEYSKIIEAENVQRRGYDKCNIVDFLMVVPPSEFRRTLDQLFQANVANHIHKKVRSMLKPSLIVIQLLFVNIYFLLDLRL